MQIRGTAPEYPDHFEIYNAPRPIYGHHTWTGDFIYGRFYVVIDPNDDYADEYRTKTLENNGKRLTWVDDATAFKSQRDYYMERYAIELAEDYMNDPDNREDIIMAYFARVNGG